MKVLVIDPKIAGISGDMLLSSLIDLTEDFSSLQDLENEINKLENCERFKVRVEEEDVGIRAKKLNIEIKERRLKNPKELKEAINSVAKGIDLSYKGLKIAKKVIDDLIGAEAKIHKKHFHLHEIASLDTIFDIVGSIKLLEKHGFLESAIYSTPPLLGSGYINIDHGRIAVPAPATLEILRKHRFKFCNFSVNAELTTPTGAALLVNIAESIFDFVPPMTPLRVGYGAGTKKVDNILNVLRVIEGEEFKAVSDRIVMIESNLDDVSGEVMGHVINKLLKEGAIDVFITQAIGKKNRPVSIISAIANHKNYEKLVELLMMETGTIGVRIYEIPRLIAERVRKRVEVEIKGKKYEISVKTSKIGRKVINVKPEYEDLRRIAEETKIPLREIAKIVDRILSGYF